MLKFFKSSFTLLALSSSLFAEAQKPTVVCFKGLSLDMITGGKITFSAKLLDAGSKDAKFAYKDLKIRAQMPAPLPGTVYDATKTSDSIIINCIGTKSVAVWVGNPDGFWDFCSTSVSIENGFNVPNVPSCAPVKNDCSSPNDKKVKIQFGKNGLDCASIASFETISSVNNTPPLPWKGNKLVDGSVCTPNGLFLSVKTIPTFTNKGFLNGISTLDLVYITKHILGSLLLDSKYKKIAADVNNNGSISTADLVALRRAILGLDTVFQNNTSWKIFPPEGIISKGAIDTYQITSDSTLKYIGVKIGDVSESTNCIPAAARDAKTYLFNLDEKALNTDEIYTLNIDNQELEGFQFTLKYDDKALELVALDENSALKGSGRIITSQLKGEQFKASFKAKKPINLSEAFRISSSKLVAEGYMNDEIFIIDFSFAKKTNDAFSLGQNQPNPFNGTTQIEFSSAQKSDYQLVISDAIGREIKNIKGIAEKGSNLIDLEMQEKGVYFYQLKINGQSAVKKMIVE